MVIFLSVSNHQCSQNTRLHNTVKSFITGVIIVEKLERRKIMLTASERSNDWIDGFLFISNRPILDLLNTKPVLEGLPTELLTDGRALERWLIALGMTSSHKDQETLRGWRTSSELHSFLHEMIEFREKLRK